MIGTRLRAIWNPDMYQGWGKTKQYFEGWYFKMVTASGNQALALIPGFSADDQGNQHAFVQVMDGTACKAEYYRLDPALFRPSRERFELDLGTNYFSGTQIRLDLPDLNGEIKFQDTQPWPKMLGAPGIMGWYSFVPFMQCNHGVVSLNHTLAGQVVFHGKTIDFTGGKGYIEKDWGRSFPRAYVWVQTNHFDRHDRASLMGSVAHIPWLTGHFIGFISGFWLDGILFKFATYTGATKHVLFHENGIEMVFKGPKTELQIYAEQAPGVTLISPLSGAMTGKINESLQATAQVTLYQSGQRIFEDVGRHAGFEAAGDLPILCK